MAQILISGYYGFDNLGDELILKTIIADLRSFKKDITIAVISADPKRTQQLHPGLTAIKRTDYKGIFAALKESQLFISGGGGLLQDSTGQGTVIYYLGWGYLAKRIFGKKVMLYAQGIGPLNKRFSRFLARKWLGKMDLITLREERSLALLGELKISANNIYVTADPVLGLDIEQTRGEHRGSSTRVGIVLRKDRKDIHQIETWGEIIDRLYERFQTEIWLIPFQHHEDLALSYTLAEKAKSKVIVKKWETIETIFTLYHELDILVSMRLHALVLAAIYGKLMIGVSYDQKIDDFLRLFGQRGCLAQEVERQLSRVLAQADKLKSSQIKKAEELRLLAKKNTEFAVRLLEGCTNAE